MKFKNLSIRFKIILIVVLVSMINSIIATFIQYHFEIEQYHKNTVEKLKILTELVGESNVATIVFNKKKEAEDYLTSLKADQDIKNALVLLPDSTVFVNYPKNYEFGQIDALPFEKDTFIFREQVVIINHPIRFENEIIGNVRIEYSLSEYHQKQNQFLLLSFTIILLATFAAIILAYFFQGSITNPIRKLERVMKKVSLDNDYSLRLKNTGTDEIGSLSIVFNSMISQIENQNNELIKAKEKSEEALKAKERFLAHITHELRTPLSSIIGLATLLEETTMSDEQADYMKDIRNSSDHLLAIINDLLEFSKIGSGKFKFEKIDFSLRKTIERIERSLEFELKNRQLHFKTQISHDVPEALNGDEFRLNQIMINLIGNAVKFTPEGSITVSVKKISESDKAVDIEFRVDDTGIGISKEKLHLIFESFTQENSSTNRKYGGTGLGLTITKQLIELQGGQIRVESEKGKGSSFIFNLPFDKTSKFKGKQQQQQRLPHVKLKIMLVDDNQLNLKLTKSMLEKQNFEVKAFDNGYTALEELEKEDFDVILLDIHMPELDGYEITEKIRESGNPRIKEIPIIALTAAATQNEINKCLECGMNDYIVKPFKKEELVTKLLTLGIDE